MCLCGGGRERRTDGQTDKVFELGIPLMLQLHIQLSKVEEGNRSEESTAPLPHCCKLEGVVRSLHYLLPGQHILIPGAKIKTGLLIFTVDYV